MTATPVISYASRPVWWRCWLAQLLVWLQVGSAQALGTVSAVFWLLLVPAGVGAVTVLVAELAIILCAIMQFLDADSILERLAGGLLVFVLGNIVLVIYGFLTVLVMALWAIVMGLLVIGLQIWLDLGRRHFHLGVWFLPVVTLLGALLVSALIAAIGRYDWPTLLWLFPALTVALWLVFATFWLPVVCVDMGWWLGARLLAWLWGYLAIPAPVDKSCSLGLAS